jgi:hypothetical protein
MLCPICQGKELVWGKLGIAAEKIYFKPLESDRFFRPTLEMQHLVCTDCGHLVRSKVLKPHELKTLPQKTSDYNYFLISKML